MKKNYKNKKRTKNKYIKKRDAKSIIIACEDSVSAPTYFNSFLKKLKQKGKITQDSLIIPHTGRTHPTGVLDDLVIYRNEEGKGFKEFDYKWIVIDRDKESMQGSGHSKEDFEYALKKAKRLNIKVAYSNPSFELWYLLHFKRVIESIDRHEVIEEVIKELKKLDKDMFRNLAIGNIKTQKNTKKITKRIKRFKKIALKNAQFLKRLHTTYKNRVNPESDNPLTNIDALIELFDKLSR